MHLLAADGMATVRHAGAPFDALVVIDVRLCGAADTCCTHCGAHAGMGGRAAGLAGAAALGYRPDKDATRWR